MMDAAERPDYGTPYVFVSYASADRERVLPIVEALRRAGIAVWLDQQGIAGGANYGAEIADAIKGAAALVLMCSAASLASRNVKQEIALGWRFERSYVPLLLEAVTIPDDLAYWLEASQWVEVFDKPDGEWLPPALAALTRVGIAPARPADTPRRAMTDDTPVSRITIPEPPPLVGREREQAVLRERLAATLNGQGAVVLIGGEAGMGKTALAAALAHEAARQGALVLDGHCYDLAETPPYGPWIDLFARYPTDAALAPLPDAFAQRGTVGAVASQMALFVQVQDFLRALSIADEAGEAIAPRALKLVSRYGDDAAGVLSKRSLKLLSLGDEAAEVLVKHKGISTPLLEAFGNSATRALGKLKPQSARRLAMLKDNLLRAKKAKDLLEIIGKYGDPAMDWVWRNKGTLAASAAMAAFVANPEPFLSGAKELSEAVGKEVVVPVTSAVINSTAKVADSVLVHAVKPAAAEFSRAAVRSIPWGSVAAPAILVFGGLIVATLLRLRRLVAPAASVADSGQH
jgi:hypothetical protein